MHLGRVSIADPPKIKPVRVYLMVCDHDNALREGELNKTIFCFSDLIGHGGIAADANGRGTPPMGHCSDEQAKGPLSEGHVGIVEVAIDPVERGTDELSRMDPVSIKDSPG